jgi:hypothetical protein
MEERKMMINGGINIQPIIDERDTEIEQITKQRDTEIDQITKQRDTEIDQITKQRDAEIKKLFFWTAIKMSLVLVALAMILFIFN